MRSTYVDTMNGDLQVSTGQPLPAHASRKYIQSIEHVTPGCHLSGYNDPFIRVLQHYNRRQPIGGGDPPQSSQGPVNFWQFQIRPASGS
jgi:hypothetical protein